MMILFAVVLIIVVLAILLASYLNYKADFKLISPNRNETIWYYLFYKRSDDKLKQIKKK